MEENVTLLAAFGAGLLSFISPCVLPLVPGYLSYVSGLSLDELRGTGARATTQPSAARGRVVVASLAFILGFSLVFVALGATASAAGQFLIERLPILSRRGRLARCSSGRPSHSGGRRAWGPFSPASWRSAPRARPWGTPCSCWRRIRSASACPFWSRASRSTSSSAPWRRFVATITRSS